MKKNFDSINVPVWFAEFNEAPRHVKRNGVATETVLGILAVVLMFLGAASENFVLSMALIGASLTLMTITLFKKGVMY